MEFNVRPQWRQWTNITCQNPTCGRCGLNHDIDMCYAVRRQCFKCKHFGHYGRMCKTLTKEQQSTAKARKSHGKSAKTKVRDSLRISTFLERKRNMRELPFSSLRPTCFRETVLNNNVLTNQLCSTKVKLEQLNSSNKDLDLKLQSAIEREKNLKQELSISEKQNKELNEQLRAISQQKIQTSRMDKLNAEVALLRKQLISKDEHCSYLKTYCHEMEVGYEQKLKEEKEQTELQRRMRAESEQKMLKQFQDLQTSVQSDLAILRQQRNQTVQQGHPNDSFMSDQCYLSPTNPFRNHSKNSRSYRGRGRF
ncbi:hypothetical protein FSP39_012663 [Pinctada imbricata]|uniref:CCHC-type domain-containing protein n=1 Tax=Pinctada imbricata TaxID=66713 RepID=A0AA88Y3T6_PINIB|nr:hypothetical protein FSP39_012663 [Pinctada imbricata]